jgi:phosphoribosylaminoimidazolecarboxamide formyltransferase/IMP cyclohydrolase
MIVVRRALVSVSDKTGLPELGKALAAAGVEVLSTGGTAAALEKAGVRVTPVEQVTGFPECLDGRVKTLHPKIHAGILADRRIPDHMKQLQALEVEPIDLVVVNLYPFERAAAAEGISRDDLIEQIDIGGPSMLRAAAKNAESVAVVCDPADYPAVIAGLGSGGIPVETSRALAVKVFRKTAGYDAAIALRLERETPGSGEPADALPERLTLPLVRSASLRYGENPHQRGALYRPGGIPAAGFPALKQLQGKELSYNNYLDMQAAAGLAHAFEDGTAVVVKHLNPCGVGFDENPERAYRRALAADPVSAFGGIVALNRPLTREAAQAMHEIFLEVIIAPSVEPGALEVLSGKKNLRVVEAVPAPPPLGYEVRALAGGWLVQTPDGEAGDAERRTATHRAPTEAERRALERAWIMVRYAKSNAIVIADETGMLGLGAGQTSRVDAVRQAGEKAARTEVPNGVRVLASDAFFPFRDNIDAAHGAGVTAIIQPGGSVRDEEVIAACDEHGMAMVFTGRRSFRH